MDRIRDYPRKAAANLVLTCRSYDASTNQRGKTDPSDLISFANLAFNVLKMYDHLTSYNATTLAEVPALAEFLSKI